MRSNKWFFKFPNGLSDVTAQNAQDIIQHIKEAIEKASQDPFLLGKDHLRLGLENLSVYGRGSPTRLTYNILLSLKSKYRQFEYEIAEILKLYSVSMLDIHTLINSRHPNWKRYLCVKSDTPDPEKVALLIIGLANSKLNGYQLQNKIPTCVSDYLNIKRLSAPNIIACGILVGAMFCGAKPNKSNNVLNEIKEAVDAPELKQRFIEMFACAPNISNLIDSNKSHKGYLELRYKPRYLANLESLLGDINEYNQLFSRQEIIKAISNSYMKHDTQFASEVTLYLNSFKDTYTAFELRDIANALFITNDYLNHLPEMHFSNVFANRLGANIIASEGAGLSKTTKNAGKSRIITVNNFVLPMMEDFNAEAKYNLARASYFHLSAIQKKRLLLEILNF